MKNKAILVISALVLSLVVQANIKLPALIADNMVLQQNSSVRIWGWANPGEKVTISTNWDTTTYNSQTLPDSTWLVTIATTSAGGPYTVDISGDNHIQLTNVLLGEVWICSGQSNMEKPLGPKGGQLPTFNSEEELKIADFPSIRLFHVPRMKIASQQNDIDSEWLECTPDNLLETQFSAVGYYYAKELKTKLDVPVGIIDASWGGTRIEPWTPIEGLKKYKALDSLYHLAQVVTNDMDKHHPTLLYNGMIAPLVNFNISGWIWYQGESNLLDVNDGLLYETKMKALIEGWREKWQNNALPFYYVQIAPYRYYKDRSERVKSPNELPLIWEAQTNCLKIPHTGMAVITDLVDDLSDIHPRNKEDVGKRLAAIALVKNYGKQTVYSGPLYRTYQIKNKKIELTFEHIHGGLKSANNKPLTFFTVAGKDRKFYPANAKIKGNRIIVSCKEVKSPTAVRFAWDEEAQPNLFNKEGFPAIPFRTDNWKL